MTTQTTTQATTQATSVPAWRAGLLPVFCAVLMGLSVIAITGHVQAEALHDAAHDVRHATGFPCH